MINYITAIPALNDNYIWAYLDPNTKEAHIVDPGDAEPVIAVLDKMGYELKTILLTHHHHDHSGGIPALLKHWKSATVIGSKVSPCQYLTRHAQEGHQINFGPLMLSVLEIPGHTLDHLAYYNETLLFSGDTLFSAGCGRVFEGTYEQMYHSLNKLYRLSDETNMYCGHEYTLANLQFAKKVEPDNQLIDERIKIVKDLRENNQPTLPSQLMLEKKVNPFLRCSVPTVISAVEQYANKKLERPEEVFKYLREWKNKG